MTEQRFKQLGCRATYITAETDREVVMNGYNQSYSAPPKLLLAIRSGETLKAGLFSRKHHLIVVDEAHTVLQWLVLSLFVFFIIVWLIIINQLVRELIK